MQRRDLLTPLPPEQWPEEIQHIARQLGDPLNIHRIIAHNPALMEAYTPLRFHMVRDSSLPPRQRELLILRTAHAMGSEYEWQHHVLRGRKAGLSDEEIERVRDDSGNWPDEEKLLLTVADEMLRDHQLSRETATNAIEHFGAAALLDALFTVGIYTILGTLLNTFDVPLEAVD